METSIRFNARGEVIVPWFVVGTEDPGLARIVEAMDKAAKNRK